MGLRAGAARLLPQNCGGQNKFIWSSSWSSDLSVPAGPSLSLSLTLDPHHISSPQIPSQSRVQSSFIFSSQPPRGIFPTFLSLGPLEGWLGCLTPHSWSSGPSMSCLGVFRSWDPGVGPSRIEQGTGGSWTHCSDRSRRKQARERLRRTGEDLSLHCR